MQIGHSYFRSSNLVQPTYMRSVSFWGKFTSGSRISASCSDLPLISSVRRGIYLIAALISLLKYQEKSLRPGYFMTSNVRRLRVPCCCLYELYLLVFCYHLLQVRSDFQDRSYFSSSHWLFFSNTLWTSLHYYSMENTCGIECRHWSGALHSKMH